MDVCWLFAECSYCILQTAKGHPIKQSKIIQQYPSTVSKCVNLIMVFIVFVPVLGVPVWCCYQWSEDDFALYALTSQPSARSRHFELGLLSCKIWQLIFGSPVGFREHWRFVLSYRYFVSYVFLSLNDTVGLLIFTPPREFNMCCLILKDNRYT